MQDIDNRGNHYWVACYRAQQLASQDEDPELKMLMISMSLWSLLHRMFLATMTPAETHLDRNIEEQYAYIDLIGRGSSGTVWRATCRSGILEVAPETSYFQENCAQQIAEQEIELLSSISNANVVKAMGFFISNSFATALLEFFHGTSLHEASPLQQCI